VLFTMLSLLPEHPSLTCRLSNPKAVSETARKPTRHNPTQAKCRCRLAFLVWDIRHVKSIGLYISGCSVNATSPLLIAMKCPLVIGVCSSESPISYGTNNSASVFTDLLSCIIMLLLVGYHHTTIPYIRRGLP